MTREPIEGKKDCFWIIINNERVGWVTQKELDASKKLFKKIDRHRKAFIKTKLTEIPAPLKIKRMVFNKQF